MHLALWVFLFFNSTTYAHAAETEPSFADSTKSVIQEVFRQMEGVMAYTAQAIDAVFSSTVRAQQEQQDDVGDIDIPDPLPITSTQFPLAGVGVGTLIINAPLSVTNTLSATGETFLATTTVAGLLSAEELALEALSVSGLVSAGAFSGGRLSIQGAAQVGSLDVAAAATLAELSVSGDTSVNGLTISGQALVASLLVQGATQLTGLLEADGGINTNGADVDLGDGSIFASNIVNEVLAGDGVTITGTTSAPIISVDLDSVVTEINGDSGEITIRGGTDISVSNLRINNTSDLASVRARGSCTDCITDSNVVNALTLTGGTIDGVIIGSSTVAEAFFSDVTIGTTTATTANFAVFGSGTANFGGGINLDTGCFSIGGICVASAASSTSYIGLFDTPSSLLAGSIQYANASGTALVQSTNFVFDGSALAIGTTTPAATLTVEGDTALTGTTSVVGTFSATGGVTLGGTLGVTGSTTISDSLVVNASSTFTDTLTVGSFVTLQSDLSVIGTSTIGGGLVVSGATTLSDAITIDGNVSVQNGATFRLYDADSSNYVAFTASTSLVGNTTWVLPNGDGNADEVMVTDGSGNIRFEPVSAIGGGVTQYTNLIDTPASFTAGAIQYVNASATAMTQSANLSYDGSSLAVGTPTSTATLTVDGSVDFVAYDGTIDFSYDDASKLIGVGTESPTDKITLQRGSFTQIGGSAGNLYSPTLENTVGIGDTAYDIEIAGSYAYVVSDVTGDEFHVFDIGDVAQPNEISSLSLPSYGNALTVSGGYAYVVTGFAGDDFHVIDISDPLNPSEVDSVNLLASANDVAVLGKYAYVVTDGLNSNFQVIDISIPTDVRQIASTSLPTNATGVVVQGDYAYVTSESGGTDFHVIDISDPENPSETDSLNLADAANTVVVAESGLYAYVGTNSTGDDVSVIDISDPSNISEVNGINLGVSVTGMKLVGDILYASSLTAGQDVHVIDVSSPSNPVEIGGADLGSGNTYAVAVVGQYVYVTSNAGIVVVGISGVKSQSVLTRSLQTSNLFVAGGANFVSDLTAQGSLFAGGDIQSTGVLRISGTDASHVLGAFSVGTTSTTTGLLVDGTMQATNLLGGAVNLTTDANGNVIRDPSDARLKTNVVTLEDPLESLLQLRGVRYQWRDKERFGYQAEIGFIAQEVDLVLPEVVRKGGDYWSINTRNILAVVVEAVKEVWAELQGTQDEVDDLRQRIGQLEAQLGEPNEYKEEGEGEVSGAEQEDLQHETEPEDESEDQENQTVVTEPIKEKEEDISVGVGEENQEAEPSGAVETVSEEVAAEETEVAASSTETVVINEEADTEALSGNEAASEISEDQERAEVDSVIEAQQEVVQDESELPEVTAATEEETGTIDKEVTEAVEVTEENSTDPGAV